ncbi:MAG: hypothetical protein A3G38_02805 [Omnitrophica WOR_2 bacterium RIFCSPLOWO2_12_FULL_51_8]|nr:MAG: hypothetical protein A3G38_02805 [Omnitrophica WOR_2 bacterium RIFCSPLOWO2_12_FULL_51_8]
METHLKAKIARLPELPGVYFFKDTQGKIVYIGKAKSIKQRVQSYFTRPLDTKTMKLVSCAADIAYTLTPSESQALLLEAGLIRKYKPKYNVSMRDDKSFPYVKITNEQFPAVCITRQIKEDGALYLGPYTSAKLLRQALKVIRRSFPFRSCRVMPQEACMYYRLGLSPAPCAGKADRGEYMRVIKNIRLILEGRTGYLINKLSRLMRLRSRELKYEEAAKIRDQISALSNFSASRAGSGGALELEDLRRLLKLDKLPRRIEAFDISDTSGREAAGSMVSFHNGIADKNNYRRFRIKTVLKIDDYGMLREVVRRRYLRLAKENLPLPDLALIDGGKGHLAAAAGELKKIGISLSLASIAKERENIYALGRERPIRLKGDTPALNLIRRVRDEAHRFALAYHRLLRRKKIIGSR